MQIVDEMFIAASPGVLAAAVHDPALCRSWWPCLVLSVTTDRGERGLRWAVAGRWYGTAEVWVQPEGDGVVVHRYLRVDPVPATRRTGRRTERCCHRIARRQLWALKDAVEAGRSVGGPSAPVACGVSRDGL